MNRCRALFLSGLILIVQGVPVFGQSVADFSLYDQKGRFHQVSRMNSELLLMVVQRNADATSRKALSHAIGLLEEFPGPLSVVALNADVGVTRESIIQELSSIGVEVPVLLDTAQVVAGSLDAQRTGEAFLIDTRRLTLLYRGPISNHGTGGIDLRDIVEKAQSGEASTVSVDYEQGELIEFAFVEKFEAQGISYKDDVAPLLTQRCAGCHVEGGLAPWAMTSHRMLQGWSPMMREVMITLRMPPGQIDEEIGDWTNSHRLRDEELALLIYWIEHGARNGDNSDPLVDQPPAVSEWSHGAPDFVVDLPEQSIPATGIVDFVYERIQVPLDEDTWINAVSYLPGDASVLHSILVYLVDADAPSVEPHELIPTPDVTFISLFVPGEDVDILRPNSGFLLKGGTDLIVKMRYLSSGRATTDRSKIGFHFMESEPEMEMQTIVLQNNDFVIPAGKSDEIIMVSSPALQRDALVDAFAPQMHGRGTGMEIWVELPDHRDVKLISAPNYNFNWQMIYTLQEPIPLPAGSRLHSRTVYDNSELNPFSLDPQKDAISGPTSWDEVLSHYVRSYIAR